ncbi:MAG: hypothetical protein WC880_00265 [Candidatus Paceibacterota bacterium]
MSQIVQRLSRPMRITLSIALILGALSGLLYAVPILRTFFSEWIPKEANERMADQVFSMYETDTYRWYALNSANEVHTATAPQQTLSVSNNVTLPSGMILVVTEKGLVWRNPKAKSELVLIAQEGITPDVGAVAPDGSAAVLFNQVTNQFDVFKVYDGGASVSYRGSFKIPNLPTYLIAVGFASPATIVMHTGRPNSFELYDIRTGVRHLGSVTYSKSDIK